MSYAACLRVRRGRLTASTYVRVRVRSQRVKKYQNQDMFILIESESGP
jgi:hypothetical protein